MARIHRKIAAKEKELRETKEASEADPVSASIVNDPAATG
jgi:hypothetical protein